MSRIKQYVPSDAQQGVETYKALIRSMHKEYKYKVFQCADETGLFCFFYFVFYYYAYKFEV